MHEIHTRALEIAEKLDTELKLRFPQNGRFPDPAVRTHAHLSFPGYQHPKPSAFVSITFARHTPITAADHTADEKLLTGLLVEHRETAFEIDPNEINKPYPDANLELLTFDIHLAELP